jgi:hypothetical protein
MKSIKSVEGHYLDFAFEIADYLGIYSEHSDQRDLFYRAIQAR